MFLPISTDSPIRLTPWVNYALIGTNVAVYLLLDVLGQSAGQNWGLIAKQPLMLWPMGLEMHQFMSYQFLHGDVLHLLGNMFFLWLFGNSVEGKMGHWTYLCFYLACGVFAGLGFALKDSAAPCLGASGSIAGITTAYLVLFPRSEVTVFYWFFFVGTAQVSSMLWILGKMIFWDNYLSMQMEGPYTTVAYEAHLAGYLFGFVTAALMLWLRALPRDQFDILALFKRWYQRQQMRTALADPAERARAQFGRVARNVDDIPTARAATTEAFGPTVTLRSEISELLGKSAFEPAARKYLELLACDPSQVLPRRQQLDVANQLMSGGLYPQAAGAYESYLKNYPRTPDGEQVMLILGILYARYLQRFDLAIWHLSACLSTMTEPSHREQAQHWLDMARQGAGRSPWTPPPGAEPTP